MPKTNAERQAEYKARRSKGDSTDRQLNSWISSEAYHAMRRLARHQKITQRALIEKFLLDADTRISKDMTDEQFDEYIRIT